MENLFPPLFVTLIVCLLLECLSLGLMKDLAMAAACRIIIFLLLGLACMMKREMNSHALRRRRRHFEIGLYQYVVLIVCTVTLIFHAFLLSFVATRLYSALLWLISLVITIDEYEELQWLQQRRNALHDDETTSGVVVDEGRLSLYSRLYMLPGQLWTRFILPPSPSSSSIV